MRRRTLGAGSASPLSFFLLSNPEDPAARLVRLGMQQRKCPKEERQGAVGFFTLRKRTALESGNWVPPLSHSLPPSINSLKV